MAKRQKKNREQGGKNLDRDLTLIAALINLITALINLLNRMMIPYRDIAVKINVCKGGWMSWTSWWPCA